MVADCMVLFMVFFNPHDDDENDVLLLVALVACLLMEHGSDGGRF